jgi:L-asparaginase
LARVPVLFTGGTISMRHDPVAGGNVPALDGAAILARTPGLDALAEVEAIDHGLTPASHFTFGRLIEIAGQLREQLGEPEVAGAVVVQGTDTIEESAFAWDLLLGGPKPVVVTGAMRTPERPDYDGPSNLRGAVAAAASPALRDQGVVVSLAGTLEAADDVIKLHTAALDTFRSPNGGSLGRVGEDVVSVERRRSARRHVRASRAAERVHLITVTVGMDGSLVDAAVGAGADAIVVAATGAGNTSPAVLDAAVRAMAAGIPVILASRCPAGRATTDYAFPGGGATWARAGAILAGTLCAPKVRVAVALGLGAGMDRDELGALLADPLR